MHIIIPALPAHAKVVAQIHVDGWRAAYSEVLSADYLASLSVDEREQTWAENISAGEAELLLVEDSGSVRGWISAGPCRDTGSASTHAEIWAMYVAPSSWAQGLGKALWTAARQRLLQQGYRSCSLWVVPQNERAIGFYLRAGFRLDRDVPAGSFVAGGRQVRQVRYTCGLVDEER